MAMEMLFRLESALETYSVNWVDIARMAQRAVICDLGVCSTQPCNAADLLAYTADELRRREFWVVWDPAALKVMWLAFVRNHYGPAVAGCDHETPSTTGSRGSSEQSEVAVAEQYPPWSPLSPVDIVLDDAWSPASSSDSNRGAALEEILHTERDAQRGMDIKEVSCGRGCL